MAVNTSELTSFIEDLEQLPTLPAVAIRLIEVTADDESGLRDAVRLIEADHSLCAKVLKIANSAYYSRNGRVSTVERAAVLLGKDMVRSVVLTAASEHRIDSESAERLAEDRLEYYFTTQAQRPQRLIQERFEPIEVGANLRHPQQCERCMPDSRLVVECMISQGMASVVDLLDA